MPKLTPDKAGTNRLELLVPVRLKLILVEAAFQMEMDENRGGGDDISAQSLSQRRVSFLEALPTVLIAAPSDLF